MAAEIHGGAGGWRAIVPYLVLIPGAVAAVLAASRHVVDVRAEGAEQVLHVSGARAPLSAFGPPVALDRKALRRQLGEHADVRAFVALPSFVHTAVLLPVIDPADSTPYWIVGSRHPNALISALATEATRP